MKADAFYLKDLTVILLDIQDIVMDNDAVLEEYNVSLVKDIPTFVLVGEKYLRELTPVITTQLELIAGVRVNGTQIVVSIGQNRLYCFEYIGFVKLLARMSIGTRVKHKEEALPLRTGVSSYVMPRLTTNEWLDVVLWTFRLSVNDFTAPLPYIAESSFVCNKQFVLFSTDIDVFVHKKMVVVYRTILNKFETLFNIGVKPELLQIVDNIVSCAVNTKSKIAEFVYKEYGIVYDKETYKLRQTLSSLFDRYILLLSKIKADSIRHTDSKKLVSLVYSCMNPLINSCFSSITTEADVIHYRKCLDFFNIVSNTGVLSDSRFMYCLRLLQLISDIGYYKSLQYVFDFIVRSKFALYSVFGRKLRNSDNVRLVDDKSSIFNTLSCRVTDSMLLLDAYKDINCIAHKLQIPKILLRMREPTSVQKIVVNFSVPIPIASLEAAKKEKDMADCYGKEWDMRDTACARCHDNESCGILYTSTTLKTRVKTFEDGEHVKPLDLSNFDVIDKRALLHKVVEYETNGSPMFIQVLFDFVKKKSNCDDIIAVKAWIKDFILYFNLCTVDGFIKSKEIN